MKETIEQLESLSKVLSTEDFLQAIADGERFAKEAKKFEEKLNKRLDRMVKEGELTEHEARWKFYEEFSSFTEDSAHESARRILDKREEDDDSADETCDEEEPEEETNVDFGDPSGDRSVIDIHVHCHRHDCK